MIIMLAMNFYTLPDFMMFANPLLYFVEPLSWHVFDQIQRVRNPVLQLEQYHQWIRRAEGLLPIALLDLRKLLTQLFGLCPYLVRQKQNDEINCTVSYYIQMLARVGAL